MKFTILQSQMVHINFVNHLWMPLEAGHWIFSWTYGGHINLKQLQMLLDFIFEASSIQIMNM